jgi:predicted signal transduction protein with EAL and GGDEF domain
MISLLRRLGFDVLKIDKTIVDGIGHDISDESMVEGLIGLGHDPGVVVVAEGIEHAEQCSRLEARRCDIRRHPVMIPNTTASSARNFFQESQNPHASLVQPGVSSWG